MFGTMRPSLSYANAMSTLAVFIALGGSSVAAVQLSRNSVRSEQIANGQVKTPDLARNAVTSAKVADGSLRAGDFKAGQLPAGPPGPAGPKGDPAATPTLKVRAATASGTVTASCAPGEVATGGGAHSVNGAVVASAPASDPLAIFVSTGITYQGYAPTSWTAAAEGTGGGPADVTAWVVCASQQ